MYTHGTHIELTPQNKPRTYHIPSLILFVFFPIDFIFSLSFLMAALKTGDINRAFYSGNVEGAKDFSREARNYFIVGIVTRVIALSILIANWL